MTTSLELKTGSWILLVGPRSLNSSMLIAIARLGEQCALRVLDGGNLYNTFTVGCAAGGQLEVLNRTTVLRAFTCYQVLSELENMLAIQSPFVVLDLLSTFYDESVQTGERKRLLRSCIAHLERLVGPSAHCLGGGGVVSVHPPAVPSQAAVELQDMLQASVVDTFFVQPAAPAHVVSLPCDT